MKWRDELPLGRSLFEMTVYL